MVEEIFPLTIFLLNLNSLRIESLSRSICEGIVKTNKSNLLKNVKSLSRVTPCNSSHDLTMQLFHHKLADK